MVEKLTRAPVEEARIGDHYNQEGIQEIITEDRWPKVKCSKCGQMHIAAIQKVMETKQGGLFEFVTPQCPNTEESAE